MKSQSVVMELRRKVFAEVARVAYESDDISSDIEAIPYKITPDEIPRYRESIYRERQIAAERVRLAMGLSLRPENKPVHITSGLTESNISDKYYEPPLMQVIPSACDKCPDNAYEVSNHCRNCVAHFCIKACPRGAISTVNGKSYIDQGKCVKCGRCKQVCPYDAITHKVRPCATACGIKAISTDEYGRAHIDNEKCVGCGQCMSACPFGAIADKSQIFQLIQAIKKGDKIVAAVAPAILGQLGAGVNVGKMKSVFLSLGFKDVYEVAQGADLSCIAEANHFVSDVATGKLPFLLTSCCPAWAVLAKTQFPTLAGEVSQELTPMVATARFIKEKNPEARVVFVGPCAAKKLEASRKTIRSFVDFVITFEELWGMIEAKGIVPAEAEDLETEALATGAGRGYACAGGVASAVEETIKKYYPDTPVTIYHAEGLADCKKILMQAKLGKLKGCLIEGMGCPGGCVAGVGTVIPPDKAKTFIDEAVRESRQAVPPQSCLEDAERLTKMK